MAQPPPVNNDILALLTGLGFVIGVSGIILYLVTIF
jgi:hypothetical protein